MRTLLVAAAAFAALVMAAPIGKAHAQVSNDDIMDEMEANEIDQDIAHRETMDAINHTNSFAPPSQFSDPCPGKKYCTPEDFGAVTAPTMQDRTPPASGIFVAACTFKNKAIQIELNQGNHVNAAIHVGDKTVSANDQQMVDANGAGVGHKIFEVDTSTVWYVAPANSAKYRSAVKLNGKWRPMQCGGFAAA